MRKSRRFLSALFMGAALAGPASLAQAGGTAEQQAACRPDVRRYCHQIRPDAGDNAFLSCLQEHRANLSRPCRTMLESNGV